MKLLDNIKKILFEEDPEEPVLPPDYSQDEVNNQEEKVEFEKQEEVVEPPVVKINEESKFKINRDLEATFDDKDILDDIAKVDNTTKVVEEVKPRVERTEKVERDSIFQSFDEQEFERSYSSLTRNEEKAEIRKQERAIENNELARRANSNFSSTSSTESIKRQDEGPKKFKPSPVLSPVFGVLNVNYTKEDIVDKKGGIKRQKVTPIQKKKTEEEIVSEIKKAPDKEEPLEVNIDSVRKKAYGAIEDLEKEALKETAKEEKNIKRDFTSVELDKEVKVEEPVEEVVKEEPVIEEPVVEEVKTTDNDFVVDNSNIEEIVEEHNDNVEDNEEEVEESKPVLLDDLEKTSTLQILDDIEKELNSIKPIKKEEVIEEERTPSIENSDTLENDLFNLIDSMYESGEDGK